MRDHGRRRKCVTERGLQGAAGPAAAVVAWFVGVNAYQARGEVAGLNRVHLPANCRGRVAGWRFHNTLARRVYVRAPFPVVSTVCRSPAPPAQPPLCLMPGYCGVGGDVAPQKRGGSESSTDWTFRGEKFSVRRGDDGKCRDGPPYRGLFVFLDFFKPFKPVPFCFCSLPGLISFFVLALASLGLTGE